MNRPYMDIKYNYPPKAGRYECKIRVGSIKPEIIERTIHINHVRVKHKDPCCGDWMYIVAWRLTEEDLFYHVIENGGLDAAIKACSEGHSDKVGYILQQMEMDLVEVGCTYRDNEIMLVEAELRLEEYLKWR